MTLTLLRRGPLIPLPPVEKALRYLESECIGPTGTRARRGVLGSPDSVRAKLEGLADAYGAEEVIAVTITYDHGARRRSYELLAEAFELQSRPRSRAMSSLRPTA